MKKMYICLSILIIGSLFLPDAVYSQQALVPEVPIASAVETDPGIATITLELKNMDVVEVLKLLATKGEMDIVISQNVRGRITLFLDDVPVWDAMQIVFQTANLAYTDYEGILRIITGREYEQEFGKKVSR